MNLLPFEQRNYTVLTKKKAIGEQGIFPRERSIKELFNKGIIVVNKPKGPTSHMVSGYIKKILKLKKAGHGGTLDPGVTGVLPIALGNATKIVQALLPAGKEYICVMRLHEDVDEEKIFEAFDKFTGKITQLPPVKSAVRREERERIVYYLNILEIRKRKILFKMGCQAGTYVRKICHDIGKYLTVGAHMAELIRTKAGPFILEEAVSLEDIEDALGFYYEEKNEKFLRHCIQPIEKAARHLPHVVVLDSTITSVSHGNSIKVPGVSTMDSDIQKNDVVAVLTLKGELLALGIAIMTAEEVIKEEKGIVIQVKKVFV